AECDYELAPRTDMPLVGVVRGSTAEFDASRFDHLGRVPVQFHLDFFGVTQPVRPGVDARHRDRPASLRACEPSQAKRTDHRNDYQRFRSYSHSISLNWVSAEDRSAEGRDPRKRP